jgi:hypothetical protein
VMRRLKAGEEHCAARFSVFHWLLCCRLLSQERVPRAVHAGSIRPAAGEIIALAVRAYLVPKICKNY